MNITIQVLSIAVAIEFFYIMFLETFATTSKLTGKVFNMSPNELNNKNVQTLFKNQGIYNGLLGIGILYAVFLSSNTKELLLAIMAYIILVALYGSYSSGDRLIVFKQGGLAIIILGLLLIS
ncbi:DUF1304 domain-containing protein [Liquorilactobacillus uvarum]|nr:DUF1304 family protein [Liquorilactobacillus uvarum]